MINNVHITNSDYSTIEEKLSNSLRPIKPDPQFISHLQSRLLRRRDITLDTRKKGVALMILTMGFFAGGFLFFLFRKFT